MSPIAPFTPDAFGLAAATSYATVIFSQKPRRLWLIDSAYNLVSFVIVGIIYAALR